MSLSDNLYDDRITTRTREGLPRIAQKTIDKIKKEMQEDAKNGVCIRKKIERIAEQLELENPVLFDYIKGIVGPFPADLQGVTFAKFVLFYDLMKRQLINDNISTWEKVQDYFKQAEK
jgi:hypothetical protein